jgi:hypothetical protein
MLPRTKSSEPSRLSPIRFQCAQKLHSVSIQGDIHTIFLLYGFAYGDGLRQSYALELSRSAARLANGIAPANPSLRFPLSDDSANVELELLGGNDHACFDNS